MSDPQTTGLPISSIELQLLGSTLAARNAVRIPGEKSAVTKITLDKWSEHNA